MKKKLLIIFFCLLATFSVIAQSKKNKKPQTSRSNIKYEQYELENGLDVILHQDKTTPIVAVSVLYHVGSKNEDPERTGFAHFFEHLLFEGSENLNRGEFDKLVTGAGGTLNANTTNDRTFYYIILPSNQLELGLYLESERMLHAKIEDIGVETQREVVKEEKRQRYDNQPYMSFHQEIFKRAFKNTSYEWTPIGSLEHLSAATLDEFMEFYRKFYVPNNATLSIAGDIDIEQTKKLIAKYFKEVPKGTKEIPRPEFKETESKSEIRDIVYDNIQLPALFQGYLMPAQGTEDYYALDMLNTLLSGGESSRLNKELVDNQEKALQVASFPYAMESKGIFIMLGIANMGVSIEELEKSLNSEIEKVKTDLVSEKEFQKVKNQIENDFVSGNSSVAGIAENLANYHVYFGNANLINTEIERYNKVTREDLKRVANKYLVKENRIVLQYLPKSSQQQQQNNDVQE
ncbi:MAG: insulinase family protein [Bacteroidota bacterium]|nr:insulinase family protein [Bacteroidota bacterium]